MVSLEKTSSAHWRHGASPIWGGRISSSRDASAGAKLGAGLARRLSRPVLKEGGDPSRSRSGVSVLRGSISRPTGCPKGGEELGEIAVALHASEAPLGFEHAGGDPALLHLAVPPALHVAGRGAGDRDHRLDGVRRREGPRERPGYDEPADGEHVLEPLEQARRGVRMVRLQLSCE